MKEAPHPTLLNRDIPPVLAKQHFGDQLSLLRDMVNYGSNLIARAYTSSPKRMADIIACGVLLKQVVTMLDAVDVLISAGCGLPSHLPARAAFEASLYLEWILQSDSERRATRYLVGNYRDERKWVSRGIKGSPEEEEMKWVGIDLHSSRPDLHSDALAQLGEIERVLAQPELSSINAEFDAAEERQKRGRKPVEWYHLDGLRSVRQMAKELGRLREYQFMYSKGSEVTHAARYKDHLGFNNGRVEFNEIRHLQEADFAIKFILNVVVGAYSKCIDHYRPEERPAFQKKFSEDWREIFLRTMGLGARTERA